ncbi:50S ribosomal protein L7/L12 [Streptosporangium lutulentum]|uniref:Ribosomal protein L7/L12 n=1 Tax=Streptosporangium lutulentum TaxID=1461250 RepID=A0ABT9QBT5_9ACTN|nr:50S ribosomal protein L7/L12 [Streptosporangium lutulentum]MDP9844223.1 ribosomal protein L7/L12 [Streptosporangium lutulentum]
MPNIGPVELLIAAALLAVILAIVLGVVVVARRGDRASLPPPMPPAPQDLQELVTRLTRQGQKIHAIKALRHHTGLGLSESKKVIDAVALGHPMWSHPVLAPFRPSPVALPHAGPDLATRVRELKAAGRTAQAIHLVRGETGMGQAEAELFVGSL